MAIPFMLTGYDGVLIYKGRVDTFNDLNNLPSVVSGDVYYVIDTQYYYMYDDTLDDKWGGFPSVEALDNFKPGESSYRIISRKLDINDETCTVTYQWKGDTTNKLWLVTDFATTVVPGSYYSENDYTEYFYPFAIEERVVDAPLYFIESQNYGDRLINPYYVDTFNTMSEWIRYKNLKDIVNDRVDGEFKVVDENLIQKTVAKSGVNNQTIKLTDIKIGDDLSGATINFNPNNLPIVLASDAGLSGFQWVIWTPYGGLNFGVIWNGSFILDSSMNYIYLSIPEDLQTPNWLQDTFTFPLGAIVENIYDLNGNRKTWEDFEIAMADTSWRPSMATVSIHSQSVVLGDINNNIVLEGNSERPYYKDKEIALLSDNEYPVQFERGDTLYQLDVDIPYVERPDGTGANLVDSLELMAHATHDLQMFETLTAQIIAAEFTEELITDIANAAIESASQTGTLVTDNELNSAVTTINNNLNLVIKNLNDGDAYTLELAKEYADDIAGGAYLPDPDNGETVLAATSFFPTGTVSNENNPIYGTKLVAPKTGFYFIRFDIMLDTDFGGRIVGDLLINGNPVASNFFQAYNNPTQNQDTRLNFPMIYAEEGDAIQIMASIAGSASVTVGLNSRSKVIYYPPKKAIVETVNGALLPNYYLIDYTNHISTNGGTWTVEETGFVTCEILVINNGAGLIKVNDIIVANGGANNNNRVCDLIPVSKGDVVKLETDIAAGFYSCYCYFIPPKTAIIPTENAVTRDEMNAAIRVPNIPSYDSASYTDALVHDVLGLNDLVFVEDVRDSITNEVGIPIIIRENEDSISLATIKDVETVKSLIQEIGTVPPQMLSRTVSWDSGLTLLYTYKGDTTESVFIKYGANSDYGTHPTMTSVYLAGPDQTLYVGTLDQTYIDTSQSGIAVEISTTADFQQGTRLWYETLLHPDNVPTENSENFVKSGGVYLAILDAMPDNAIGIYLVSGDMDFTSANGSVVCRLEVDNLLTTLVKNGNYCSFRVQSSDGSTMTLNTSSIQYYDGASGQLKNAKVTISGTTFYEFDTDVGYAGKTTGRALIQNVDTGIQYSVLVSGASTTTATDRSDRYSLAVMPWESVMFNPNRNIDKNDLPSDIVYFENIDAIPTQNSGNLVNSGGVYSEAIVPLDTHKTTDRFRWQDMYDAERQSIVRDANSDGLKADEDNFVTIDLTSVDMTVNDEYGGVIGVTMRNTDVVFCTIKIDEVERYSSEGLTPNVPVTKYLKLETGLEVVIENCETVNYAPFIIDEESVAYRNYISINQNREMIDTINQKIADMEASVQNKTIAGVTPIDITNTTYTVSNPLGARLTGQGVAVLGLLGIRTLSTGIVTLDGTEKVYDNTSLLAVGDVLKLSINVPDATVITSSGMANLSIYNYIQGTVN